MQVKTQLSKAKQQRLPPLPVRPLVPVECSSLSSARRKYPVLVVVAGLAATVLEERTLKVVLGVEGGEDGYMSVI
jgi:hypothetical protein